MSAVPWIEILDYDSRPPRNRVARSPDPPSEEMKSQERDAQQEPSPPKAQEKRTYEPPKVESVRLTKEAAESLT